MLMEAVCIEYADEDPMAAVAVIGTAAAVKKFLRQI